MYSWKGIKANSQEKSRTLSSTINIGIMQNSKPIFLFNSNAKHKNTQYFHKIIEWNLNIPRVSANNTKKKNK